MYWVEIWDGGPQWLRHTDGNKAFPDRESAEVMMRLVLFFDLAKDARVVYEAVN